MLIQEMRKKALAIKHRKRRSLATGNLRAYMKAETDARKLYDEAETAKQITIGFFNAIRLVMATKNQHKHTEPHSSSYKPVLRHNYKTDSWIQQFLETEVEGLSVGR